jgi:hypothetical protein
MAFAGKRACSLALILLGCGERGTFGAGIATDRQYQVDAPGPLISNSTPRDAWENVKSMLIFWLTYVCQIDMYQSRGHWNMRTSPGM